MIRPLPDFHAVQKTAKTPTSSPTPPPTTNNNNNTSMDTSMDQPANAVIDRLVGAVQSGRLDYLTAYHQAGLSVTVHDNSGWALLLHACMNHPPNQPEMVAWLLEAKADPNQRSNKRVSALQVAARFGFEAIVETLLEAKADINAQDHQGTLPCSVRPRRTTARCWTCSPGTPGSTSTCAPTRVGRPC
jgi:hypothetical protein